MCPIALYESFFYPLRASGCLNEIFSRLLPVKEIKKKHAFDWVVYKLYKINTITSPNSNRQP